MKTKIILLLIFSLGIKQGQAQNTFPANGNVGLGTNTPERLLHVHSTSLEDHRVLLSGEAPGILFSQDENPGNDFLPAIGYSTGPSTYFTTAVPGDFSIRGGEGDILFGVMTGPASDSVQELMRITHGGNLGIGTTSPATTLHVNGTVRFENIPQNNGLTHVLVEDADGDIHWRAAASLGDGTGTDNQNLSLINSGTNRTINISGGTGVNFSVADNDNNSANEFNTGLALNGTSIEITDGGGTLSENLDGTFATDAELAAHTDADADPTNEIQTLSYDANPHILSISDGNNVDIAPFPSYPASAGDGGGNTNSYFGHQAGLVNTGNNNTFIGHSSGLNNTTGDNNVAIGRDALIENVTGTENIAIGFNSGPNGGNPGLINTIAIGSGSEVGANGAVAVGDGTSATGNNSTALGNDAEAIGANSLALGYDALAIGANSLALGNGTLALGVNSTAIGNGTIAFANNIIVVGNAAVNDIVTAGGVSLISDGRFKEHIEEDVPGLEFIEKLRPVSYDLNRNKLHSFLKGEAPEKAIPTDRHTGFIAQEVEQIIEENGYAFWGVKKPANERDNYGIRYATFVVPLVKGMQEQQQQIEALRQQNESLQQQINDLKSLLNGNTGPNAIETKTSGTTDTAAKEGFALYQNVPNPFNETTTISASVPETVQQARLSIYTLQGQEVKDYPLTGRGKITLEIALEDFPAGIYLYGLIADGKLIDTKKMIVKK